EIGNLEISPNPAKDVINIQVLGETHLLGGKLHVFDIFGRNIHTLSMPNSSFHQLDISNYLPGLYFVEFIDNQLKTAKGKFIKIN
ncbi:MAG: T9SS type A sorting domain-containing protein, partial [Bacteroidota bacterium]